MYNVKHKSPTHGRHLQILHALKDGIDVFQVKRDMLSYLIPLIIDAQKGIRMAEVKVLKNLTDIEDIAFKLGSYLNFSINNSIALTRTCDLLGRAVLSGHESSTLSVRKRNIARVKVGLELLDILFREKKISRGRDTIPKDPNATDKDVKEAKGRAPFRIKVVDEEFAFKIGIAFHYPDKRRPIYTSPLLLEPVDWTHFHHPVMGELVRNTVDGVYREFSLLKTPKVFEFMNKIKKTSFKVNKDLLGIFNECLKDPLFTHEKKTFEVQQLQSIMSQQEEVLRTADSLGESEFWLSSFLDFRGRFYYANTYFNPQGNKVARSLLLFGESEPIGEKGWEALLKAAASEAGKSKLPPEGKLQYAKDNLDTWLEIVDNPTEDKRWQEMDNPFGFLSIILELHKAVMSGDKYGYASSLPIFIDASNSGTQILSALGKDTVGGALSNLVKSDTPGDVYMFIGEKVWSEYTYTPMEKRVYDEIHGKLVSYQNQMNEARRYHKWDRLSELSKENTEFYKNNKDEIAASSKVFWADRKHLMRKLCKKPVMTIPYSAKERTISNAIYDEWRPDPEMNGITKAYCFQLALDITRSYNAHLKIPTDLMNMFIELGLRARDIKRDLAFEAPVTGFKFVQNARTDKIELIGITRRGERMQLRVCVGHSEKIDYKSVKSASSPNSIHALDAAFMAYIVLKSDYPMMAVHDSFATYPGSYDDLNTDIRNRFVEMFHEKDVLEFILKQCNSMDLYDTIEKGNLNILDVLDNPFAFDV